MADPVEVASLFYAKLSFWVTFVAVILSVIAIYAAFVAIRRADLNSSAATLVALHDGYRAAWKRLLATEDIKEKEYEFADLMNLIEINTGLHASKSLKGVSEELSAAYLTNILKIFSENEDFKQLIHPLQEDISTFKYTRAFCKSHHLTTIFEPKLNKNAVSISEL